MSFKKRICRQYSIKWQWFESNDSDYWFAGTRWTIFEDNGVRGLSIETPNRVFNWNKHMNISLVQFLANIYDSFDQHRIDKIILEDELVIFPEENRKLGRERVQYLLN